MTTPTLTNLITAARDSASRVLDTYRGRGQPKIQIEMANLLRMLATKAESGSKSSPELVARVEAAEGRALDLENQMLDLGHEARRFTPNDQLRTRLAVSEGRADKAEKRIAELEASPESNMLNEDTHPWPEDGSEFEVIFRRPSSVIAKYVGYKRRWLTTDGYSIADHHREPEGWLPLNTDESNS